ncbi:hypothetical protein KW786_02555 [Candidatus Parcubacteria bacterium]|nr:hypothetical protein [Candidatus Parcubacteria bacterium]
MHGESGAGFTIIEVLVVAGIIVVFSTILISNFPKARLQFSLSRAAHKFEQDLRKAQGYSFASAKYTDPGGNLQEVAGYGVHVDTLDNKKYIIYADAPPGNHLYDNEDYIVNTIDLSIIEPGVIIKEIRTIDGVDVSINFTPPNPITTISNISGQQLSNVDIVFSLENDDSKTKTVFVNGAGLIEIK